MNSVGDVGSLSLEIYSFQRAVRILYMGSLSLWIISRTLFFRTIIYHLSKPPQEAMVHLPAAISFSSILLAQAESESVSISMVTNTIVCL